MLLGWETSSNESSSHETLELAQPPKGGDFTLSSAAGPVSLADFRGKVVLIYFGYTWCPDICPLNLSYLRLALDALTAEERKRVQILFVSVDPERDAPERLREYTAYFAPEILGVTGTPEEVAETAALYGAAYRRGEPKDSAMGYFVDHSAYTYLVDTAGRLRQTLDHATPPDRIVAAIRSHLTAGKTP
jgi:protein SCO1/2